MSKSAITAGKDARLSKVGCPRAAITAVKDDFVAVSAQLPTDLFVKFKPKIVTKRRSIQGKIPRFGEAYVDDNA